MPCSSWSCSVVAIASWDVDSPPLSRGRDNNAGNCRYGGGESEGEVKPIFADLYIPEIPLLVEAKGTVEWGSIRMA
jgi:hypothetical protein